jgi:hypothetical protein
MSEKICRAVLKLISKVLYFTKAKTLQFPTQSSSEAVYLSCLKSDFTIKINYRNIPSTLPRKRKISMTSADVVKCFKMFANVTT